LGLAVLMERFPDARPVSHAQIRPLIDQTASAMLATFRQSAPDAFADRAVVPEALEGDHILLEGERIEILPPMHGDTDLISAVHVPALDTLIAADFAYADTHVWVKENTTSAQIDKWRQSLTMLEGIGAGTVIPGHRLEASASDASVFTQTRRYLDQWETALGAVSSADELKAKMLAGNEDLGLTFALDRAVAAVYPQG
jgi:hypothetical protein